MRSSVGQNLADLEITQLRVALQGRPRSRRLGMAGLGSSTDQIANVTSTTFRQPLLVIAALRHLALCRAVLAERRTGATLGDAKGTTNMLDAGTATRRAQ